MRRRHDGEGRWRWPELIGEGLGPRRRGDGAGNGCRGVLRGRGGPFIGPGRWPAGSDGGGGAFSIGGRLRRGGEEEAAPIEGGERSRRPRGVRSRAEGVAGGHGGTSALGRRRRRAQLLGEEEGEGGFWFFTFSETRDVNLEGANAEMGCWAGWAENEERRRPGRIPCSGWNPKE
jgi:hypothetical protein